MTDTPQADDTNTDFLHKKKLAFIPLEIHMREGCRNFQVSKLRRSTSSPCK